MKKKNNLQSNLLSIGQILKIWGIILHIFLYNIISTAYWQVLIFEYNYNGRGDIYV